jgi:hypothetical protein
MPFPDEIRPLLHELLYVIDRTSRMYRSTFVHAPPQNDQNGFIRFLDLADRTAMQARLVLSEDSAARGLDYEFRPFGHFLGPTLADKMRARRAIHLMEQAPSRSPRPSRGLH